MSALPLANVVPIEGAAPAAEVSEDSIASAFASIYAATLRFDHDEGRWYEWDGVRWRPDRTARGFHYARQIGRRMGDGKRQMCKAAVASGAERFCRSDPALAVTKEYWDRDLWLLGTPGGVVDLRSGDLMPSDPKYCITKVTQTTPLTGRPERWLAFLEDATGGDQQVIGFLQEWCGYSLTGDTREQSLLFAHGGGGNGKSVFINTFTKLMGDYAITAAMETFTAAKGERHSTEVAMLAGARLVTASETEEGRAWAEARIKQLTGGDPITARFMRKDNFTYIPQFKLTFIGNHEPALHNVDEAMRRRFRIIPFNRKPAKPDRRLEDKLVEEWPQILNWMIEGALRWQDQGLSYPDAMRAATEAYFDAQDVLGQWLNDECVQGGFEAGGDLFQSWKNYALSAGEEPGSQKAFTGAMQKRGYLKGQATDRKRTRILKGISLKKQSYDADQGYPVS